MSDNNDNDRQILQVLGRIEGQLKGIQDLVHHTSETTNTRIQDLKESINKRIEDHREETNTRFDAVNRQINKKSAAAGSLGGAIVAGLVEIVRAVAGN